MKGVIAIDPGCHHCGVAHFEERQLRYARLVRAPDLPLGVESWAAMAKELATSISFADCEVVIEFPRAYQGGKKQMADVDGLELAATVGAIVALVSMHGVPIRRAFPDNWKGQMDKATAIPRVLKRLSPLEASVIEPPSAKSLIHNIYDAVGIGLWAVGRFEKERVYAR